MGKDREVIPIFFAVDDFYIPFLAVTLRSLVDNSSTNYYYLIKILHTNVSEKNKKKIKKFQRENIDIEFVDLNYYIDKIKDKLYTRDYYTKTTYFRLFIPNLYPQYDKALYIDSDVAILDDIANLYNIDIGDCLIGGVTDSVIQAEREFKEYAEKVVGVIDNKNYFNAGIIIMNLDEMRRFGFQEKFVYLLDCIKFTVAQDQDYLNRMCKGKVKMVDARWNIMPIQKKELTEDEISLVHYNLADKPWHYDNLYYSEYFWRYAEKTEYYEEILKMKREYTEDQKYMDTKKYEELKALAQKEADCVGDDRAKVTGVEKAKDRIEILKKIEILEREGKFDVDPEDDPPTIPLLPDDVDYLKEKRFSKIKAKAANALGKTFVESLLNNNKLIISGVEGLEYLDALDSGAILTCNHFNPFDVFTIEKVFRDSIQSKTKKLYKIIREGNYTNFPGFYGFLFRNCDTLPLSSNKDTMAELLKAINVILEKGDWILIYPEQSLWWNYRKPKPLKEGAFKFAVKNNVPVIPIFITMKETDNIGDDGFPIMEYFVHINKPIYPKEGISDKQNAIAMKNENFEVWKKVYEDFYKIPLEYTTVKEEDANEEKAKK